MICNFSFAQTQPTPQAVPYNQNFDNLDGTNGVSIPSGMQGWTIATSALTKDGNTDAPLADRGLFANGSASSSGAGIYDFVGKIGLLCNNSNTLGIALAIDANGVAVTERVRVKFDGMVIRNVAGTGNNNIINALILQYRIGTSGSFKNVGVSAQNGTTVQTTGNIGVDIINSSFLLPAECSHEPILQLRWTLKNVSGVIGDQPSFAIDNIQITADGSLPPPKFTGYKITTKNITLSGSSTTYATNLLDGVTRTQKLDQYGGASTDYVGNTTGYFTTYKDDRDVWYMIDPAGYKFYSIGVNSLVPQGSGKDPINLIKSVYANTIGNFSNASYISMPYCVGLNLGYTFRRTGTGIRKTLYDNGISPIFDADFVTYCTDQVNSQITDERIVDKNLLGYFSDNELPIANPYQAKLIDKWLDVSNYGGQAVADGNANYQAVVTWMKSRHGGVLTSPNSADDAEWPGQVAERYYKVCSEAIKKRDKNHLYIGSRLHQDLANRYQFEAAGKYVDVLSVNNYNVWSKAQLDARYNVWEQYTGKPFMVTEFYAQADDSGLPNTSGAGFNVKTQQDRADFFEHYTMEMLKRKWNVGFQYFKLNDDAGQSNKGLIDSNGDFWQPMKTSFTKIAQDIYQLRRFLIFGEQDLDVTTGIFDGVKIKATFSIVLFPNPARNVVNLTIDGYKGKTGRINIYDFSGRIIQQEYISTGTYNNTLRLNLNTNFKQGLYILEFSGNGMSVRKKLIVR
nr:T9SS type A sorting domain-containing protein [uncultured Pedobacter sp.]